MSRAAYWLTDARGIPDLHKCTTSLVGVVRQPLIWAMLVALFITDVVWSARVGLSIGGWGITIGVVGSLLALSAVYRRRSSSIADMAEAAAVWVAFTATGAVLTYLAAIVAWPLQDAAVSNFDRAIGFDWPVWRNAVLTRPLLHGVLQLAYASLLPQIVLAIAYFPKVGLAERNGELVLLAMLTLLPTTLISALWPVLGPFATFAGPEGTYLPDLLALRAGGPWHFDLPAMEGIVEMPSYHMVRAVLFTYAFRGTGLVGLGIAGLNALMFLAIPPIGGHYLADVIVGGAVAVFFMLGSRWLRSSDAKPVTHRPGRSASITLKPRHVAPIAGLPATPSPADPSSHPYAAASGSAAAVPRRAAPWGS
jgi:hypothetical protein